MPWIRDRLDRVPVPRGLQTRIEATVRRRRIVRFVSFAAVAASILVAVTLWRPKPPATPEPAIAFRLSLKSAAAEPLRLQESRIDVKVSSSDGTLVFTFMEPAHD